MRPLAWWDVNRAGWFFDDHDPPWETELGCGVLGMPCDTEFTQNHSGMVVAQ